MESSTSLRLGHIQIAVERIEMPPLASPRAHHEGVVLGDGRVLLVGGNRRARGMRSDDCGDDCRSIADAVIVDVDRATTTSAPPLQEAREGSLVARAANGVIVAGGLADYG